MKLLYQTYSPYARKALVFAHEVGVAQPGDSPVPAALLAVVAIAAVLPGNTGHTGSSDAPTR